MGEIHTCAFSGHRTLPTETLGAIRNLLDRAIAYAYEQGCREFYNGGAIGFDTEAAERVLLFRESHPDVRLIFLLPCKNQDERWSFSQKLRYKAILKRADEVRYINEVYTDGCMRERNAELVRVADMLVAYLSHTHSGAGQTVNMAKRKGIAVYNLYGEK